MVGRSAPASVPTLRKLGADLRWLIEKSGANPEGVLVQIGVPDRAAQHAIIRAMMNEFDQKVMRTINTNIIVVHGVHICVTVVPEIANMTKGNNPPRELA